MPVTGGVIPEPLREECLTGPPHRNPAHRPGFRPKTRMIGALRCPASQFARVNVKQGVVRR